MKTTTLLPFLIALPLAAAPEPVAGAPATSDPVLQDRFAEFMEKFRKAMKIGANEEMNRLLRTYQHEAIYKIIEICEHISENPTEQLEEEIDALRRAWNATYKTDFVDHTYEYFSLLRPEIKEHRRKLKVKYDVNHKKFIKAEEAKDKNQFGGIGMEMKGVAEGFAEIGDHFFASQAYLFYGKAFDEFLRGSDADLRRACEAFEKCVQSREKIGLKDQLYSQTRERYLHLEKAGYGDPEKAAGAAAKGSTPTEASAALPIATTFEVVSDLTAYRRPFYNGDELYAMWLGLYFKDKGSSSTFAQMQDNSPKVFRTGASKVEVDVDGDGQGDVEIPLTGKITPVQFTLGEGEERREWAFLSAVGGQRDNYNGIQFNLSPSDENMTVYIAPAASLVGMVGATPIRVFDDNMDGVYGSDPMEWGHLGMVDEVFQTDLDSVVVGSSKVAQPWSEYMKIGEGWYKMASAKGGMEITATPVADVETGTAKLSMKGVKADWLVVRGNGTYENSFFEIAASKGTEVPAGRYELVVGQVSKGKKTQMAKALVVAGRNTPVWTVEPGKTTTIQLGGPFGFDFEIEQDDENVTVFGDTIAVTGSADERYLRLWNCVVRPEVSLREAGKKRGGKGEAMKRAATQEEVSDHGYKSAWFPFDMVLPKKKSGTDMEAQLFEKKNKLFGKIESVWRN